MPRLVLASGSPRRQELLERAGFVFEVAPTHIEERTLGGETPLLTTVRLAIEKAEESARSLTDGAVVLGADTSVVVGDTMLGKPTGEADAAEMLLGLSGRNHLVLTAWAVVRASGPSTTGGYPCVGGVSRSTVRMREIARADAEAYARSGEPLDKAGSYAAQGDGRRFIAAVVGPLDNVIGLPVAEVSAALGMFGIRALAAGRAR